MRPAHTQKQGKRDGASPNPRRSPLLLSTPWIGVASHTRSEARRTQSAPSMCTQQAAAQSPSYRRNGEQKQSPSRTIGATGRKEEVGAFQQRRQQRYSQRDK
ncbi:hypothetical protein TcCL_Unassigned00537 [Trypanosoma cruzi]|nr:hypothetical protein TcCL_Unassigned00537 [Trypanosoma cruzi]